MSWNAITIAVKDLQLLLNDKGALAVLFLMPVCFATIIGGASQFGGGPENGTLNGEKELVIDTYFVNEDRGIYGDQVREILLNTGVLSLTVIDSGVEADKQVGEGVMAAAIVVPAEFSEYIEEGNPTRILIISDPTQEITGNIVAGIVNEAISEVVVLGEIKLGIKTVLEETGILEGKSSEFRRAAEAQTLGTIWTRIEKMRRSPLISIKSETLEGIDVDASWNPFTYYAPSFGVMFAFFLVAFMASSLMKEKEQGLFHRILASPVHPGSVVSGKIIAFAIIVFLQISVMFCIGNIAFDMPLGGSGIGLILITLTLAMAATSLGLMIGALSKSSAQAGNVGTLLGFILMVVGGCIFPIFREGGILTIVSYLTPHAHALNAYMMLMADEAGLMQVLPHVFALFGFASIFSFVAVRRLRFI